MNSSSPMASLTFMYREKFGRGMASMELCQQYTLKNIYIYIYMRNFQSDITVKIYLAIYHWIPGLKDVTRTQSTLKEAWVPIKK